MENWDKYSREHFLLLFDLAQKEVQATIEVMESIQRRGRLQLAIALSGITYAVGDLTRQTPLSFDPAFNWSLIVAFLPAVGFALVCTYKYKQNSLGYNAEKLLEEEYYHYGEDIAKNELAVLYNLIQFESDKAKENNANNKQRMFYCMLSFWCLVSAAFLGLIASLVW